jgi:hypothetical protein
MNIFPIALRGIPLLKLFKNFGRALAPILVVALGAYNSASADQVRTLITELGVQVKGHFTKGGANPATVWRDPLNASQVTYGSFDGADQNTGALTTAVFRAPNYLELFVSGFPSKQGIRLFLEAENDHSRTIDLKTRVDPGFTWRRRVWKLPPEWAATPVRLVVSDEAAAPVYSWVGVTLPRNGNVAYSFSIARAIWRSSWLLLGGLLLLLPGTALAIELDQRVKMDVHAFTIIALVATGILGYICFWIYFWGTSYGKVASVIIITLGSIRVGYHLVRNGLRTFLVSKADFLYPLVAAALVSVIFASAGSLYLSDEDAGAEAQVRFFDYPMPPDNVLPELVANRLYAQQPLRPRILEDWQTSDRPPLQSGLVLLELPFWFRFSNDLAYESISTVLQSIWIVGIWVLLHRAGFSKRSIVPVIGICIFSGLCFFHTIYAWPKLLAAAFCIMAMSFVLPYPQADNGSELNWTKLDMVLFAFCIGLALLSHTGCALTFVALPVLWFSPRKSFSWRIVLLGIMCLAFLLLPWLMFQKVYDPPGDQLIKANLTGALNRDVSLLHALRDAYCHLTFKEFLNRRLGNLGILFVQDSPGYSFSSWKALVTTFVVQDFFVLFHAIGLLNIGVFVRLLRRQFMNNAIPYRVLDRILVMTAVSIIIWVLIMFDGKSTVIHQGSLANVLLILVSFALYVEAVFPRGIYVLFLTQVCLIFPVFVFSKPVFESQLGVIWDGPMDPGMLTVGIVGITALGFLGYRITVKRGMTFETAGKYTRGLEVKNLE